MELRSSEVVLQVYGREGMEGRCRCTDMEV